MELFNYDEYNNLWYEENVLKFEKDGKYLKYNDFI